ncbi:DUF6672 family protein [Fretibacterium sp. OH1220_COT-178]|uniref:DUF6672 family protein n=1 Tax=Fretibacterium sp. OH1220_COT-178 TaxID=2491047 RepID=UPI000F5F2DF5|nr:DUF6672 family protein [Fretibacterium sp. OH1220_COT-178]RRD64754.1 hypothetical protein EII26_05910 [Fretibacterium sp. OH1220_COT-178]
MRVLQRTVVLLALIALGVGLFYMGREHQVFLDNRTIEAGGATFRALEQVNVSVNGGEPIELLERDRDVVRTVGPTLSVRVEVLDSMGGDVERTVDLVLRPGFRRDLMLSLPLVAAGRDDFVLPPPTAQQTAPEAEPAPPPEEGISPPAAELPPPGTAPEETRPAGKP